VELHVNLTDAVSQYLANVPGPTKSYAQSELHKFARWAGWERQVAELMPPEVAQYAEGVVASGGDIRGRLTHLKEFLTYLKKQNQLNDSTTSLSAHVKIPKENRGAVAVTSSVDDPQVILTSEGLESLKQELEGLKGQRTKIADDIRIAAADKDFKENAPLDAAREQQGKMESRVRDIEALLQLAVVADASTGKPGKAAVVGSQVVILNVSSGKETAYTLVGSAEADPINGKLSISSPVGQAVLNRKQGDEVEAAAPRGQIKYKLVSITS
jgi:transcription elongation factor GreA